MARQMLTPGPVPLYYQLKQILRGQIEHGSYQPGDQLPSEPELTRQYGISRITARQALDELETEGLVIRRHGKGTYVAEKRNLQESIPFGDLSEELQGSNIALSSRLLESTSETVSSAIAQLLRLPQEGEIVRIERLYFASGQEVAYEVTHLPFRYGEALLHADLASESIPQMLEREHFLFNGGSMEFSASLATPRQADALKIPTGTALLSIRRQAFEGQNPLYIQDCFYRPDRVIYSAYLQQRSPIRRKTFSVSELRPVVQSE